METKIEPGGFFTKKRDSSLPPISEAITEVVEGRTGASETQKTTAKEYFWKALKAMNELNNKKPEVREELWNSIQQMKDANIEGDFLAFKGLKLSNFKDIEKNLFYLDLGEIRIIPKLIEKGTPVHYEFASTKNKKAELFQMNRKLPNEYQNYSADSDSEKLKAKYPLKLPTPGVTSKPLDEGEKETVGEPTVSTEGEYILKTLEDNVRDAKAALNDAIDRGFNSATIQKLRGAFRRQQDVLTAYRKQQDVLIASESPKGREPNPEDLEAWKNIKETMKKDPLNRLYFTVLENLGVENIPGSLGLYFLMSPQDLLNGALHLKNALWQAFSERPYISARPIPWEVTPLRHMSRVTEADRRSVSFPVMNSRSRRANSFLLRTTKSTSKGVDRLRGVFV